MKKNQFKKAVIAAALTMATTGVMAADGSAVFQWAGTVPAATDGNNVCIQPAAGSEDLDKGLMVFAENADLAGTYDVTSSTELRFEVLTGDCVSATTAPTSYDLTLDSLSIGVNGLSQGVLAASNGVTDGDWYINHILPGAAPDVLAPATSSTITTATAPWVGLTIGGTKLALNPNDSVVAQAFVLVTTP